MNPGLWFCAMTSDTFGWLDPAFSFCVIEPPYPTPWRAVSGSAEADPRYSYPRIVDADASVFPPVLESWVIEIVWRALRDTAMGPAFLSTDEPSMFTFWKTQALFALEPLAVCVI